MRPLRIERYWEGDFPDVRLHVNLSPRQFRQKDIAKSIAGHLRLGR